MADIAMCGDEACPSRQGCYRFMAKPSEFLQTYGAFGRPPEADRCDHFWPLRDKAEVKSLDRAIGE